MLVVLDEEFLKKLSFHVVGKKNPRIRVTVMNNAHKSDKELYSLAKDLKIKLKPVVTLNVLSMSLGVSKDEYPSKDELFYDMIAETTLDNRDNLFGFIQVVGNYTEDQIQDYWDKSSGVPKSEGFGKKKSIDKVNDANLTSMINQINASKSVTKLSSISSILDKFMNGSVISLSLSLGTSAINLNLERSKDSWISINSNHRYSTYDLASKIIKNGYKVKAI